MSANAATPTMPAKPRRRWLRWLLSPAILALTALGVYFYLEDAARRDWDAAFAETDLLDSRWRLMDIEADRPTIPDAENSSVHAFAILSKAPRVHFFLTATPVAESLEHVPFGVEFNQQQAAAIRGELAKVGPWMDEARKLKDMPRGRFPLVYEDTFHERIKPGHNPYRWDDKRHLHQWFYTDAQIRAHDGKYDEAVESCLAFLYWTRGLEGEAFRFSFFMMVMHQCAVQVALERVLSQGTASEAKLAVLQAAFTQELSKNRLLAAFRGERAGHHHLFENMRTGKLRLTQNELAVWMIDGNRELTPRQQWLIKTFPGRLLKQYPDHLRSMNRLVEIASLPNHERGSRFQEWDDNVKKNRNTVTTLLITRTEKTHLADQRWQMCLRTGVAGLACERYRLRHNAWPASLQVLVQEKLLDAVPLDPIDGQPLRYRKTTDGVVVYSINVDGEDNQGKIDRNHWFDPGYDVGFRLLDPHRRRQPPMPPIAEKEI